MPSAKGLFHRAIAMSGAQVRGAERGAATRAAEQYLARLGLTPKQLDRLQQLPWRQLQEAFFSEPRIQGLAGGPVVDGGSLPRDQWFPDAPAVSADVPLMMGSMGEAEVLGQIAGNVVGGAIGVVLGATVGLIINAGITHVMLMLLGGARQPYEATLRVTGYSQGAVAWTNIVPLVGPVIAAIWGIVLSIIGAWLVSQIADMRRNQDCVLSGHRNCAGIDVHAGQQ